MQIDELDLRITSNCVRYPERLGHFSFSNSAHVKPGDLALFEVLSDEGGYIEQLDLDGNPVRLTKGDKILETFGIRQSGTNISGDIPRNGLPVQAGNEFQILSSAGIVGHARRIPADIGHGPVNLRLESILTKLNHVVNLRDLTPYCPSNEYVGSTPTILSLGSSAECGKTTMVAALISELSAKGLDVAACKTNGSGNIRDKYSMRDAGASFFLDYVDMGLVTTYDMEPEDFMPTLYGLLNLAEVSDPDVLILECGGDVMWGNIPAVLSDPSIQKNVIGATMCSTDYMAAYGAFVFAKNHGLMVPTLFDAPVGKEGFYRKGAFEQLVQSTVYDIMVPEDRANLGNVAHKWLVDGQ